MFLPRPAALWLVALASAAAPGAALSFPERPVRSLLEARHENVVVQEWDSSCGAAALATLLRYQLGDPVTERAAALGMLRKTEADRVRLRGGFSFLDMKRYAESRGFVAEGYGGLTAGQLLRLSPAIVPIRTHGGDHFVVFRGVVRGQAVLADPAFGNRTVPYPDFAAQWKEGLALAVKRAAGRDGNRLWPTPRDLLRVGDEDTQRGLAEPMPQPLGDGQLALAIAADLPPPMLTPIAGESPGRGGRAPPLAQGASPPAASGPAPQGAALPSPTSASSLLPSTSTTGTSGTITVAAPPLASVTLPSPVASPGIAITAPTLPAVILPLGR